MAQLQTLIIKHHRFRVDVDTGKIAFVSCEAKYAFVLNLAIEVPGGDNIALFYL